MKKFLGLVFVLAPIVLVSACGGPWFPKCDDPKHPCPPVEPDYPPPRPFAPFDGGDARG